MYSKNVSVTCPYCGAGFSIPVGAKYKNAEAIALGVRLSNGRLAAS
jgi:predicted molibdopterin-dependent oxidoreductase YjgC